MKFYILIEKKVTDDTDVQKVEELIIYPRNLVANCSSKLKKEIKIEIELENFSQMEEKIKENENKIKNPPNKKNF